jgi:hypothetical protein
MSTPKSDGLAKEASERIEALEMSLRRDVGAADDPRFKALAEAAAEVLGGLRTAFGHYREGEEEAWR